jgi:hypothetical protein
VSRLRTFLWENSLSLVFGGLFLITLAGQALAGHADFNQRQLADGLATVGFWPYLTTSDFAVDVTENWQSEFLQFFLYTWGTVWLVQRGSPESKSLDQAGPMSDEQMRVGRHAGPDSPTWARTGGWRTAVFSRSLCLTMGTLFLLSWVAQSVTGWSAFDREQLAQQQDPVSWAAYLLEPDFWNRSLQNWQSELLAVGSFALLAAFLRQRGSAESKPVGAAHEETGVTA